MFINNNFTLDAARIGNTSTSATKIVLPYTGPLPDELSDATSATITIMLQVGLTVNIILTTTDRSGKKHTHPVEAAPQEIYTLLQPFFFTDDGKTRWDNGLDRYWMGMHQSSYVHWRRLFLHGNPAADIA